MPASWSGWLQICLSFMSWARTSASALHAVGFFELVCQIAYGLLIQGRLLPAQSAEGRHLDLFGQVGDDSLVGLEPAQDVRSDKCTKRLVRRTGLHLLDQTGERLGAAQQARVEKIEQRPEIAKGDFRPGCPSWRRGPSPSAP